jgi:hypothetical protein
MQSGAKSSRKCAPILDEFSNAGWRVLRRAAGGDAPAAGGGPGAAVLCGLEESPGDWQKMSGDLRKMSGNFPKMSGDFPKLSGDFWPPGRGEGRRGADTAAAQHDGFAFRRKVKFKQVAP